MQCANSRLPSVDVPFSFLYFYIFLCCILYDFHFPPSYYITYECLPFLPQSICVAFSSLPLISGINFPASKSKIKAFAWSQEPKMQLLHTSERKGREGRRESSGAGSHLHQPPAQGCTCHLRRVSVTCSQCRDQTGAVVCYPTLEPPYIPAHPPPPIASLANRVSLVIRPIHRYYTKNYTQSTTFVHFSSCVPALALPYHATLGSY